MTSYTDSHTIRCCGHELSILNKEQVQYHRPLILWNKTVSVNQYNEQSLARGSE